LWPFVLYGIGACITVWLHLDTDDAAAQLVFVFATGILAAGAFVSLYEFLRRSAISADMLHRTAKAITPVGELAKTIERMTPQQVDALQMLTEDDDDMKIDEPDEAYVLINKIPVTRRFIYDLRRTANKKSLRAQRDFSDGTERRSYKLVTRLMLMEGNLIPATGKYPAAVIDWGRFDRIIEQEHLRSLTQIRALEESE
jgi:hypothetical protein